MRRSKHLAHLVVVLLCAFGLKWHYSTASVDQLRWILWPTTKLVEFVTGAQFAFESHAGYMNSEHTFLIAASCAGVNFLITAFVMLGLRKLWRDRNEKTSWRFIPIAVALAFIATIVTNAVRISLALQMLSSQRSNRWLNAGELHRLEGILVYFGSLLLLFVVAEEIDRRLVSDCDQASEAGFSRFLFPLGVYYVATLGVPLVNGAIRQPEFWEHSAFVLLVPLVIVGSLILIRMLILKRAGRMPAPRRQDVGAPTTAPLASLRPGRGLPHPTMFSQPLD